MIYKRCSRCGKRIKSGTKCKCSRNGYKEYDRYSRDKESKAFYHSHEWERVRRRVLERDEVDVYLYMTTGEMVAADTVHHVIPLRDDPARGLDPDNLVSLHHDTHSMIEQMYKKDKREAMLKISGLLRDYRVGRGE